MSPSALSLVEKNVKPDEGGWGQPPLPRLDPQANQQPPVVAIAACASTLDAMLTRFPKWLYTVMFTGGVAFGAWRVYAWAPVRYVPAKFDTFIERIEKNRWSMAGWIVADDYSDRWGYDKASLIDSGRSAFRNFQWIEIRRGDEKWTFGKGTATVSVKLELHGEGNEIAAMARDTAATATEPFVFTFRKSSAMPWSWHLVSIDQPQLKIERGRSFGF